MANRILNLKLLHEMWERFSEDYHPDDHADIIRMYFEDLKNFISDNGKRKVKRIFFETIYTKNSFWSDNFDGGLDLAIEGIVVQFHNCGNSYFKQVVIYDFQEQQFKYIHPDAFEKWLHDE